MPDWFNNSYVVNIVSGVLVVGIVAVLAFFRKRIWIKRPQSGESAESLDLRFVEFISYCGCTPLKDGRTNAQIQTQWDVTNVSKSGMPARLLRARLANPRLPDARPELGDARGDVILLRAGPQVIAPNTTERITIHFCVVLSTDKLKSLTLNIVVIDQLSNEHSLPRIKLKPHIPQQPATQGET